MIYVNPAGGPTPTLSGVCNLFTPVAVCTLNVYETGAAIPVTDGFAATTATNTVGTTPTLGSDSGIGGGSKGGAVGSSKGTIFAMSTLALGFCIGLAFAR